MKGFEMISNCPLVLKVLDTRPFLSQVGKSNWNQKSKEPKHCLKGGWACERAGPSSSSTSEKGLEGRVWPSVAQGMSLRWDLDTCPPASLLSLSQHVGSVFLGLRSGTAGEGLVLAGQHCSLYWWAGSLSFWGQLREMGGSQGTDQNPVESGWLSWAPRLQFIPSFSPGSG